MTKNHNIPVALCVLALLFARLLQLLFFGDVVVSINSVKLMCILLHIVVLRYIHVRVSICTFACTFLHAQ